MKGATNRSLNKDEQIEKLNQLTEMANKKREGDLSDKLASFVIYAGIVEFVSIQTARLVEQVVLKGQLAEHKKPTFSPHEDEFFYNKRVKTRIILYGIKKFLPFHDANDGEECQQINKKIRKFIKDIGKFLDKRNDIIHRIGSPATSLDDLKDLCDKALDYYDEIYKEQTEIFGILGKYRFSEEEMKYFYGK